MRIVLDVPDADLDVTVDEMKARGRLTLFDLASRIVIDGVVEKDRDHPDEVGKKDTRP